jgi:hypothetical protein
MHCTSSGVLPTFDCVGLFWHIVRCRRIKEKTLLTLPKLLFRFRSPTFFAALT